MREIKFRAWNSAEERMYSNAGIEPHAGKYCVIDEDGAIYDMYGSAPTLMEYIGRKDKNDVELCEGDRVRIGQREPGWIVYDHTKSAWIVQSYAYWCFVYEVEEIEIIGNLYETPELVKATEKEQPE